MVKVGQQQQQLVLCMMAYMCFCTRVRVKSIPSEVVEKNEKYFIPSTHLPQVVWFLK
jgi:hypothetical protein